MDLHLVNRRLVDMYGKDYTNQSIYRIVFSEDQLETREGDFEYFIPGTNCLIRRTHEITQVKKYSYLTPQYVLEKLMVNHHKEIKGNDTLSPANTSYEPLWAFGQEENGKPKQIVWRAVELLIKWSLNPPKPLSESDIKDDERKRMEADEKVMLDLINENAKSDAFSSSLHDGDTVILSNTDYLVKET